MNMDKDNFTHNFFICKKVSVYANLEQKLIIILKMKRIKPMIGT